MNSLNMYFSKNPTHIFYGNYEQVTDYIARLHQETFCSYYNTKDYQRCFCTTCKQIQQKQFQHITWISPEQDYTLDTINIIFETTRLQLDAGTIHIFVLENADRCSQVVANKLLKLLEEPPHGYYFFLATDNIDALLDTIRSRSIITHVASPHQTESLLEEDPIIKHFIKPLPFDPNLFLKDIKKEKITASESMRKAHELLYYYQEKQDQNKITILRSLLKQPPQSGSHVLFWKYLYLMLI